MIEKAKTLPADEVFLDLEDAVAPDAKGQARTQVAAALADPGWAGQLRGVRVNDWTTPWTYSRHHRGGVHRGRVARRRRAAEGDRRRPHHTRWICC